MGQLTKVIKRNEARVLVSKFLHVDVDNVNGYHEDMFINTLKKACKLHCDIPEGCCIYEVTNPGDSDAFLIKYGNPEKSVLTDRKEREKELADKDAHKKAVAKREAAKAALTE